MLRIIFLGIFLVSSYSYGSSFEDIIKKARSNNDDAQLQVAKDYFYGHGVKKNYKKALFWFEILAKKSNADAEYYLGKMYDDGLGVRSSASKALYWYTISSNQNNAYAEESLGDLYLSGMGVPNNQLTAYTWFRLSLINGFKNQSLLNKIHLLENELPANSIAYVNQKLKHLNRYNEKHNYDFIFA